MVSLDGNELIYVVKGMNKGCLKNVYELLSLKYFWLARLN